MWATIIVSCIVAVCAALAVTAIVKRRKKNKGKCSGCGGCDGRYCDSCHSFTARPEEPLHRVAKRADNEDLSADGKLTDSDLSCRSDNTNSDKPSHSGHADDK